MLGKSGCVDELDTVLLVQVFDADVTEISRRKARTDMATVIFEISDMDKKSQATCFPMKVNWFYRKHKYQS